LGVDLVVTPGVVDVAGPRLTMRPVAGLPLIHVEKPQYSGTKKVQKLAFDYLVSVSVLFGALPVMIGVAIAIKLTNKGPVFYRSERIGREGQPFQMIKFRTMVDGADKQVGTLLNVNDSVGGVLFKIKEDPRVTGIGKLLRKYSRRATPVLQRVATRHECRRTSTPATPRGGYLQRSGPPATAGASRHHGAVAGQWTLGSVVGELRATRSLLRGELVDHQRRAHRREDDPNRDQGRRRVLSRARLTP
jgi:hypothetical protein